MGIFLEGCFLFNFITLLEYSVASYLDRKRSNGKFQDGKSNFLLKVKNNIGSKKSSSTAEDGIFLTKGECPRILVGNKYSLRYFTFVLAFYNNFTFACFRGQAAVKTKNDARSFIWSDRSETISSWCVCSLISSTSLCSFSTSVLDYLCCYYAANTGRNNYVEKRLNFSIYKAN